MMKIFLTNLGKYNEGECVLDCGKWIELPISEDDLQKAMDEIGINEEYEEWFISDYECDYKLIGEYDSIEELNEMAEKMEDLDEQEQTKGKAIIEYFGGDIEDAIENIDDYILYEDINNDYDLGYYWIEESGCYTVPEFLQNYIDYEAFGRDYSINANGGHTSYGFIEEC